MLEATQAYIWMLFAEQEEQVPLVPLVEKTDGLPRCQAIEKIVENLDVQTVQDTQFCECWEPTAVGKRRSPRSLSFDPRKAHH